jgi:hypothetical protein
MRVFSKNLKNSVIPDYGKRNKRDLINKSHYDFYLNEYRNPEWAEYPCSRAPDVISGKISFLGSAHCP